MLVCCLLGVPAAYAGQAYKCVDADGSIAYQDTPCADAQRQQTLDLPAARSVPAQPVPKSATTVGKAPESTTDTARATPQPSPRGPKLFRCTRATDSETYLSRTGRPAPYAVPLGMVSGVQRNLADSYSNINGQGVTASAPELMPKPGSRLVGGNYTLVRDACRPLPPRVACQALEQQYEDNEDAIDDAFSEERPRLLQNRKRLKRQMAGCSR